jgi:hypothetical protein
MNPEFLSAVENVIVQSDWELDSAHVEVGYGHVHMLELKTESARAGEAAAEVFRVTEYWQLGVSINTC